MPVTNEEISHIARLARLRLSEDDVSLYATQVGSILEYIAKLQELDTDGVEELAHGAGLSNVFRVDAVASCEPDVRTRIVASFPEREGDLLRVPAVFSDRTE